MFSKNYFLVFILTFFVAGFFFLVTPDKAFSQIGCCQNPGGNCVRGMSNDGDGPPQTGTQMKCQDSDFLWFGGETCPRMGAPVDCPSFIAMGCCVIAVNTCVDGQTVGQCDVLNGTLEQDELCADVPECNVPPPDEGCCVHGDDDCTDNQTSAECPVPTNVEFVLETACSGVPQCNLPPPGEGCCVLGENNCVDDETEQECTDLGGIDFVENTACDFVPICNVPPPGEGCCVLGDNNCLNDQTEQECTDLGGINFVEETACSAVPQCDIPPPGEGCCVLGENDCINDQNADECDVAGGDLELGLTCSAVPECNVVPPPPIFANVPTIGQWGMIAMAGLLGIFSLFIIMRRHRYNVS